MLARGLVLLLALALSGCAGMNIPGLGFPDPEERQVLELIAYAQRAAVMSAEQQRGAYGADNQAFDRDHSPYNRVRLALLLATPGASVRDDARAAGLLEPIAARDERA
ncbi:MAG: hypothetical protein HYU75_06175, partial [Betaproteobacteria bacterium]|nr:hypothetical protein [Betaproteobacteria bacterium]